MKIVIEIPEDVLKRTVFYREFKDLNDCVTTIKALEKAMPLPEHHGRLIDEQQIIDRFKPIEKFEHWRIGLDGLFNVLSDAPTIIEGSDAE